MNSERYEDYINSLKRHKESFTVKIAGATRTIVYKEKEITFNNPKELVGKGYHICKLVSKDIDRFIISNPDYLYPWIEDYKNQLFNLQSLSNNIGDLMIGIDVHSCYFETAYQLGNYISEKTYIQANREKEKWKIGRNASIGSLAKETVIHYYEDGIERRKRRSSIKPDPKRAAIRHHIIGTVYERFMGLIDILKEDYYMFLTDCIYCHPKKIKIAKDYLTSFGYKVRTKMYEVDEASLRKRIVHWYDIKKDEKKFYNFSPEMIYNY